MDGLLLRGNRGVACAGTLVERQRQQKERKGKSTVDLVVSLRIEMWKLSFCRDEESERERGRNQMSISTTTGLVFDDVSCHIADSSIVHYPFRSKTGKEDRRPHAANPTGRSSVAGGCCSPRACSSMCLIGTRRMLAAKDRTQRIRKKQLCLSSPLLSARHSRVGCPSG